MQLHGNARLTRRQRAELQRLHREEQWSIRKLAAHFKVNASTVQRWAKRSGVEDRSSAPRQHGGSVVSATYREAVIAHRQAHPHHGPRRIAHELRQALPKINHVTVWRILKAAGLSRPLPKKTRAAADSGGSPPRAVGHPGTARDSRPARARIQD
jgi:transposase